MHTARFVRAALSTGISPPLDVGDTRSFILETDPLSGVDWERLHPLVLVDARPSKSSPAYDVLQAAHATFLRFTVRPATPTFMVDPDDQIGRSIALRFLAPGDLAWTATTDVSWLTIDPMDGLASDPPTLSVVEGALAPGWQEGAITFTTDIGPVPLPVRAYHGDVSRMHLPTITKNKP
jgi:hypothetical protein